MRNWQNGVPKIMNNNKVSWFFIGEKTYKGTFPLHDTQMSKGQIESATL